MTKTNHIRVSAVLVALVVATAAVVLALVANPAWAATTITVNTTTDENNIDGDCSLREAVIAANTDTQTDACPAGDGADTILFDLGQTATITLGSQLPTITDASGLTIDGGSASITVSGNDAVRVFEVNPGAKLTLASLTVADGKAGDFGGGIYNLSGGTVEVTNSTFSGNSANDLGGAIDNRGTLTVTNSTFSDNKTTRPDGNNFGGGIFNDGTAEVTKSTFSGNSSLQGGGIANFSTLEVTNSTFSENSGSAGGGIFNNDTLTVTNSTFSGNSSTQLPGGAIRNQEGFFPGEGGTVTLSNTIVANSPSGGNCGGTIIDGGYNIDDGTTCGFSTTNNSQPSTNPLLDPEGLQDNGGPTKTVALQEGSPAIDAGATTLTTDQRGVSRPQGVADDIGAFELEATPPPPPAPTPPPPPAPTPPPPTPDPVPEDCTIVGTEGDDVLIGTSQADVICGLGGNDTIKGKAGNDTILGGKGDDTLYGGKGKDTIYGGEGRDSISGDKGGDTLIGGSRDSATGSSISRASAADKEASARDNLDGGTGKDTCDAGSNGTEKSC